MKQEEVTYDDVSDRRSRLKKEFSAQGKHRCRIVVTGGPGGGKTTAADLFRREIGDRVVIVPESALHKLWEHHPRFVVVGHNPSFFEKIGYGLADLKAMVSELDARRGT